MKNCKDDKNTIYIKNLNAKNMAEELQSVDFDASYISCACPKYEFKSIKLFNLKPHEATILKQICLSLGSDCALSRGVLLNEVDYTDCIVTASCSVLKKIVKKLEFQPFRMKQIAKLIENNLNQSLQIWQIKDKVFDFQNKKYVMGILNVTPDSFSDGGLFLKPKEALEQVELMIENGIDILDIGAESTRPGAKEVESCEQIKRLKPILKEIVKEFPFLPLSLDTRSEEVARFSLDCNVDIINDVSSGDYDEKMIDFIKKYNKIYIITHSSSTPDDMQNKTKYKNLIDDIYLYLKKKVDFLEENGIKKVIIDPGIGFGKTEHQNIEIIKRLSDFKSINKPILIALSRKSFITKLFNISKKEKLDYATSIYNTLALHNGACLMRVHQTENIKHLKNILSQFINNN